jgi:mannosyltransferase OCH1-like enzyme
MVYQEEVAYVYNGINIDMDRTIDRTLRNWLTRSYLDLAKLELMLN